MRAAVAARRNARISLVTMRSTVLPRRRPERADSAPGGGRTRPDGRVPPARATAALVAYLPVLVARLRRRPRPAAGRLAFGEGD